jgi:hypothetical protein
MRNEEGGRRRRKSAKICRNIWPGAKNCITLHPDFE